MSAAQWSLANETVGLQDNAPGDVRAWNAADVIRWLNLEGLHNVEDNFREHGITGQVLLTLTDVDLAEELRIHNFGTRRKLIVKIEELRTGAHMVHGMDAFTGTALPPNLQQRPLTRNLHLDVQDEDFYEEEDSPQLLHVICFVGAAASVLSGVIGICSICCFFIGPAQLSLYVIFAALGVVTMLVELDPHWLRCLPSFQYEVNRWAKFCIWLNGRGTFYILLGIWELAQWTWLWALCGLLVATSGILCVVNVCEGRSTVAERVHEDGLEREGPNMAAALHKSWMIDEETQESYILLNIICIAGSVGSVVTCLISIIGGAIEGQANFVTYSYLAALSTIVVFTEMDERFFGRFAERVQFEICIWAKFMTTFIGRGIFLIIVGFLEAVHCDLIHVWRIEHMWQLLLLIFGGWMMFAGGMCLGMGYSGHSAPLELKQWSPDLFPPVPGTDGTAGMVPRQGGSEAMRQGIL